MLVRLLKVNRAGSLIELTAALALVVSVTFFVTTQDTLSMAQAQRDARHAAAMLWLENEAALARASLPPWAAVAPGAPPPHLCLYTNATTGEPRETVGVRLIGDAAASKFKKEALSSVSGMFTNCIVRRTLVDRVAEGYDGLIFDTYRIDVILPHTLVLSGPTKYETNTRMVKRVFSDPGFDVSGVH